LTGERRHLGVIIDLEMHFKRHSRRNYEMQLRRNYQIISGGIKRGITRRNEGGIYEMYLRIFSFFL